MNKLLLTGLIFFQSALLFSQECLVIPAPKECTIVKSKYIVTADFSVSIKAPANSRINDAAVRMLNRLKGRTGLFINQYKVTGQLPQASLSVEVERNGECRLNEDESYQLQVDSSRISLKAPTDMGAMHGLETLLQLLQFDNKVYYFQGCEINDSPRFPWRGLLIDVGRHFMPVEVIKRNLDGMAAAKLNVLHFHLSEDQGFRIECKAYPKLHQMGSDGQFFTQEQIRDIIAYADALGIRVMPEFDMPGHTSSWFVGYPKLASGSGPYNIERKFGILIPAMNPTSEYTYQFLDTFFREMSALFPDEYMHIGGDENNGQEWDANPDIQSFKTANGLKSNEELQASFNKRILGIVTRYGKKMVGWDEIMQPDLPKNILIQSWRKGGLLASASNGFPVILSKGFYIDLALPASEHYLNDPLPDTISLTDEQKKLIMGGEATMWSEMVTPETVDSRIWPRTAAIAERLWSPASVKDIAFMYKRMDRFSIQLEELGLNHERYTDFMLRRLTGSYDNAALKTLVDVLEPVKYYHRSSSKEVNYTTYAPFGRIVDAARPDARVARHFNMLVDTFLKHRNNKEIYNELRGYLKLWISNKKALEPVIEKTPSLKEIEQLSVQLAEISGLGLKSLINIKSNKRVGAGWRQNALAQLKAASKSRGQAEIAVIKGIRELVEKTR
jgi:N-acetyl-beta-hexosaminidase